MANIETNLTVYKKNSSLNVLYDVGIIMISMFLISFTFLVVMSHNIKSDMEKSFKIIEENKNISLYFTDVSKEENKKTLNYLININNKSNENGEMVIKYKKNLNDAINYLEQNSNKGITFHENQVNYKKLKEIFPVYLTDKTYNEVYKDSPWLLKLVSPAGILLFLLFSVLASISVMISVYIFARYIDSLTAVAIVIMTPVIMTTHMINNVYYEMYL